MWGFLINVAGTALGLFLVLGLWFAIQSYVRWKSGCGTDRDLLDYLAHGCMGCKGPGSCSRVTSASKELAHNGPRPARR